MTGQDQMSASQKLEERIHRCLPFSNQDVQATSSFKISQMVFCWLIVCCNWLFSIDLMTTVRDRINAHLPIVLEVLRTGSLVVIALSTICASQSLKQMAGGHDAPSEVSATHKGQN